MVYTVDQEGQAQDIGEEDELLPAAQGQSVAAFPMEPCSGGIRKDIATHLPDVTANLPGLGQEQQRRHPLVGTEAGLAREVVQVSDEPVQEVLQPFIFALVVDPDSIRRDVVDSQVQELWSLRVLSHGYVCHFGVSRYWHDNQVKKKLGILNPP